MTVTTVLAEGTEMAGALATAIVIETEDTQTDIVMAVTVMAGTVTEGPTTTVSSEYS